MSGFAATEEKVRASFAKQSLMAAFDAELVSVTEGAVTITAPISENVLQQQGAAHGGLAFALGDSAAGYAALTMVPHEAEVMTTEMKIHFLRPAFGARLVAEGRVLKPGRRLFVVAADVFAETDTGRTQIATLLGSMVPV